MSQLLQETQEHMEHVALCLDALSETIHSLSIVYVKDFMGVIANGNNSE